MTFQDVFSAAFGFIERILLSIWPILLFFILFPAFQGLWLFWRQSIFKKDIKWILLELNIPREILKSPQAMEKVLDAIHALGNAPTTIQEKWWFGEVTRWYSFEMVSFGGEIHFFMRIYRKQKNLIEAAFFAQYPDIEIVEVEDYIDRYLPDNLTELKESGRDIWGGEMKLVKEDAYPIKSYKDFESPEEEKQFDPASVFLEVLGKIDNDQFIGIQFNSAPASYRWFKKWDDLLQKLKEPKFKKEKTKDEVASFASLLARSPGEIGTLEAVEKNLSKRAYNILIRFVYVSPKKTFYDTYARRGITAAFGQYSSYDLNSLLLNYDISTKTGLFYKPYIFAKTRNDYRKQRIIYNYRNREVPPETRMGKLMLAYPMNLNFSSNHFTLSTESLATIFHPPTHGILTAPHIKRVESKKASPPAGMAIFGDESDIEKFQ